MCDNNSAVQINHQHRTPNGHLVRARERNSRIRGRGPVPFAALGCGAQKAIPIAPRWACAAVRPARARAGRRARKGRRRWAWSITRQTRGRVCKCQPPTRPARSPGAAMPHLAPQRNQGRWGVAPSHLPAARGLRAAESRPKATIRIHMQMPMKTGFSLFSEFLKIEQPHKPTDSTKISASSSRFKWCLGLPCGPPYLSKGQLNINIAYFCDLALGGAGSS